MIRRTLPMLLVGLAAGCSGGGGGGSNERTDRDILIRNLSGPTSEDGGMATFEIVLRSRPDGDLTLDLSSDDPSEGIVSPQSLLFTTVNWNAPQTVSVFGVDDGEDDGNVVFHVEVGTPVTNDDDYAAIQVQPIPITNLDDETASVHVGSPSGATTEQGGEATVSIRLTSKPTEDVTVPVTSDDTTEATVSPAELVFSPLNWGTAQSVTISGADDDMADGTVAYTITVAPAVSADPAYDGLAPLVTQLTLQNFDDETPGVTTTAPDSVTSEVADTGTLGVRLRSEPTADVTIVLDVDDASEAMVSTTSLTFTQADWDVEQTVTVTGLDDLMADGHQLYNVTFQPTQSNDPAFDGLDVEPREFVNLDDEQGGITVAPLVGVTTEMGGEHTFTVVLDGQPTDDVTLTLVSTDLTEGITTPGSLTFTPMDWDQPQMVTVRGALDRKRDGNRTYYVAFEPAMSSDSVYAGLVARRVKMTNIDDGPAPEALIFDDGIATHAAFAADTAGNFSVVMAADAAEFEAGLATARIAIVELSSTVLGPSTEAALATYVSNGGVAIVSYHDLDASPALQAALGVSASAPHVTARHVFQNPATAPNLFRWSRRLATVMTAMDTAPENGSELTLTGDGSLPIRFDASTGPGATAVTREGRVIVNGFLPDDMDASDVDGDGRLDMLELYENQIEYVTRPGPPGPLVQYDNTTEAFVGSLDTVLSPIEVTVPGAVADVMVSFWFETTPDYDDFNLITLISPEGARVGLSILSSSGSDRGPGWGTSCDEAGRTFFYDGAAVAYDDASSPFVGTFRPSEPLAGMLGQEALGTWQLEIVNDFTTDEGTLRCWSLYLSTPEEF